MVIDYKDVLVKLLKTNQDKITKREEKMISKLYQWYGNDDFVEN